MYCLKNKNIIFLSLMSAFAVSGCASNTPLTKSQELVKAEVFYKTTAANQAISQNAEKELKNASAALQAAARAQTPEEMDALAYKGNNQIKTAILAAEIEKAKKRVQELREQRSSLQEKFNQLIMDQRSIKLPE